MDRRRSNRVVSLGLKFSPILAQKFLLSLSLSIILAGRRVDGLHPRREVTLARHLGGAHDASDGRCCNASLSCQLLQSRKLLAKVEILIVGCNHLSREIIHLVLSRGGCTSLFE